MLSVITVGCGCAGFGIVIAIGFAVCPTGLASSCFSGFISSKTSSALLSFVSENGRSSSPEGSSAGTSSFTSFFTSSFFDLV